MDFYGVIALDEDSTGTIPVESPLMAFSVLPEIDFLLAEIYLKAENMVCL